MDGLVFGILDDLDERFGIGGKDKVAVDEAYAPFIQKRFFLLFLLLVLIAWIVEFDDLFFLFVVGEFPDAVVTDILD